jgi:DNA-binding response OmpR family regulator
MSSFQEKEGPFRKVLIVDDKNLIRDSVRCLLPPEDYAVEQALSGLEGLRSARKSPPHLILLNLVMRGMNGLDICRLLRTQDSTSGIPVILLTELTDPARLLATAADMAGGDGFLTIPFLKTSFLGLVSREFPARTPAWTASRPRKRLTRGRLKVDLTSQKVQVADRPAKALGAKRFKLLCALLRHPDGVSRERLLSEVWEELGDFDSGLKIVDVMVHRLRSDLASGDGNPIVHIPGGYKLVG